MTDLSHRKDVRLAGAALQAALASKWQAARQYVVRIHDECGGEGLTVALMAWCDTFVAHAMDGAEPEGRPRLGFVRTDTGQLDRQGSERVPARVQWAGRLIAARAALDETAWQAVVDDLPDDPVEVGSYVSAVLESIALTINGLPRGYVLMGGGQS